MCLVRANVSPEIDNLHSSTNKAAAAIKVVEYGVVPRQDALMCWFSLPVRKAYCIGFT